MFLTILFKDIKRALRDRKALVILILMPAILTTVLGMSLGGVFGGDINLSVINIGIVDNDAGDLVEGIRDYFRNLEGYSEDIGVDIDSIVDDIASLDVKSIILEDVFGSEEVKEIVNYKLMSETQAKEGIDNGSLAAYIVIPAGFNLKTTLSMSTPFMAESNLQLVKNIDYNISGSIVEGILYGLVNELSRVIIGKDMYMTGAIELGVGESSMEYLGEYLEDIATLERSGISVATIEIDKMRRISSLQYYAAAMGVMFILYTIGYGAEYILKEKYEFTYQRQIVGGVSNSLIVMSRLVATTMMIFFQLIVLSFASKLIFDVYWGELIPMLLVFGGLALSVGGFGAILCGITLRSNNYKAANFFSNIGVQLMALIGGSFVPMDGMPLFKAIGNLMPNGAGLNAFLKLMYGYGVSDIIGNLLYLYIGGIVFAIIGYVLLKSSKEVNL